MTDIENLDIKFQLTNEYLRNGGLEQIFLPDLLQEMIEVKYDQNLKPIPESIGPRLRSFMTMMLLKHTLELPVSESYQSEYESLLQKSYSFDQTQINTEEEFDELVKQYENSDNVLFRGQREASWRLYSTLQRMWITTQLSKNQKSYLNLIKRIIKNGKTAYQNEIEKILDNFNIDSLNDVSVLGYMQHHGCPTPLLDWTYCFDISLYFALDKMESNSLVKEIRDYISVYYLEEENLVGYKELLNNTIETLGEKLKKQLIERIAQNPEIEMEMKEKFKDRKLFDKDRFDGSGLVTGMTEIEKLFGFQISFFSDKDQASGLIFSLKNSPNIRNQNGAFTLNPSPISPLEVVGKKMYLDSNKEADAKSYRFCRCYNINKSLKHHIRKYLDLKGITKKFVYASKDIDTWPIYKLSLEEE